MLGVPKNISSRQIGVRLGGLRVASSNVYGVAEGQNKLRGAGKAMRLRCLSNTFQQLGAKFAGNEGMTLHHSLWFPWEASGSFPHSRLSTSKNVNVQPRVFLERVLVNLDSPS